MAAETRSRRLGFRPRRATRSRGLTLIEMLVIMAICGILAALLVPLMLRSRASARMVVCANNLRGLGEAYSLCLAKSRNYFPDAYYTFEGSEGVYKITLNTPESAEPDVLFDDGYSPTLLCPCDNQPAEVLGRTATGESAIVQTSYAYNVGLPLMFRNVSRVNQPVNTVTFYDGELDSLVGTKGKYWDHSQNWAKDTVDYRHGARANYLFLDGHVESSGDFAEDAFRGGDRWLASSRGTGGSGDDPYPGDGDDGGGEGLAIGGTININPNNSRDMEFTMTLPDGYEITRDDLHSDDPHDHAGFHPDYLEYTGPAVSVRVKPKGNGNQNGLTVDGEPYPLENKHLYVITSDSMDIHLYNSKRNTKGKAMGKWWISIDATEATITVIK